MSDDPFAEPSDDERTVMRPRPGGRAPVVAPAPRPSAEPAAPVPQVGTNKLVASAAPLLAAAIRVAGARGGGPDPAQLQRAMVDAVRAFERDALATGLDTRSLRAARYALCATIDDLVLSTPWGAASLWSQRTLVSIFGNEVSGGERFYDILEQMQKDLGHHAEAVELMYLCMALGFEGRYRVLPRGTAALTDLRQSVYRTLRARRGEWERELSPHWQGMKVAAGLRRAVPLWAVGLGTLVAALAIYVGLNLALAGRSDVAFAELFGLPPRGPIAVPRAEPAAAPLAPAPASPQAAAFVQKLHTFLAPEIKAGLVTVLDDQQSVTVRLTNRNMFGSGQAVMNPASAPLIGRVGEALQDEPGRVAVNGYTDNQPIRTVRFPSNFELSQARADAVAALIAARLSDPKRVRATGHADADPIASNATPDGRQQNRRTEVVLVRGADAS